MAAPLEGVRVLDFSRVIAGPLCTQHMADLGAEVLKIENPVTGDEVRGWDNDGTPGRSAFFTAFNRSKKSVAIDLKTSDGQDLVRRLAERCDVLVENFRPGVMHRLNIGHEEICALNPRIVYVSISAYGASGSMSDRPGFDPVLQAESGMMAQTGAPDDPPLRHPLSIIDTLTAVQALSAITSALFTRERHGHGDYIDLALYDTAIGALNNAALAYFTTGKVPERSGNSHMHATPTDLFATQTESIYMAIASDRLFGQFCSDVIGRPELSNDDRFKTPSDRFDHRSELKTLIEDILKTHPADYWLARLRHLPAGKVRSMDAALEAPETAERRMIWEIADETGTHRVLGSPFKFSRSSIADPMPPPHLGEHTDVVLSEYAGVSGADLADLRSRHVIR